MWTGQRLLLFHWYLFQFVYMRKNHIWCDHSIKCILLPRTELTCPNENHSWAGKETKWDFSFHQLKYKLPCDHLEFIEENSCFMWHLWPWTQGRFTSPAALPLDPKAQESSIKVSLMSESISLLLTVANILWYIYTNL